MFKANAWPVDVIIP